MCVFIVHLLYKLLRGEIGKRIYVKLFLYGSVLTICVLKDKKLCWAGKLNKVFPFIFAVGEQNKQGNIDRDLVKDLFWIDFWIVVFLFPLQ